MASVDIFPEWGGGGRCNGNVYNDITESTIFRRAKVRNSYFVFFLDILNTITVSKCECQRRELNFSGFSVHRTQHMTSVRIPCHPPHFKLQTPMRISARCADLIFSAVIFYNCQRLNEQCCVKLNV